MKKNFKFLSSLALAGILSTSVMGITASAATTDVKTEPVGIYSQLIENKKIVPFVLANKDDVVTIKDIKNSGKFDNMTLFKGSAIPSEETVVCTGDTFTADGEEYTAVIYGDVDRDGTISMIDALTIQDYRHGKVTLDELQSMAANVIWKDGSEVDMLDALQIQLYRTKKADNLVDGVPTAEQEPEENYSITLSVNDNGYINNNNRESTTIGIKLSETSEETTELKFKVLNSNGEEVTVSGLTDATITIDPHTDYSEKSVSFANTPEGKYTIQILDKDGDTVLGTINTEINTTIPAVAQVSTNRTSTTEATMSLNAMGDSDIVKMYYVVSQTAPSSFDTEKNEFTGTTATKTMNISDNKIENAVIANELTTNQAYKVYYVVENSYGNQSTMASADILSDTVNTQIEKVKEIAVPNLEKNEKTFTWETVDNASGYIVTVLKDGKIVAEENVVDPEYPITLDGAGKYQISVIAKGDNATSKNSEATMSSEIEVVALKSVTDVAFEMTPEGKAILSWKDENNKEDVKEYKITLYTLNDKGIYEVAQSNANYITTKTSQEITIDPNTVYKADVEVIAQEEQSKLVNSEKTTLDAFYKIEAQANIAGTTENSATLTLNDVKVNGKSATYQVNVYAVRTEYNPEVPELTFVTTKDVEFKDGKIIVDGLESNTTYAFKLIADVDGIKGESDYIRQATTLRKTPEISNLTVVKNEKEAVAGTIYKDGTNMIINGEKYDLTQNYSAEFKNIANIIDHLHAKDIVTIDGETVTLNLPSEATDESTKLDLSTAVKDMTVIIESNNFEKQIVTTVGSEPKEIILKGNEARFNVSELNSKKITLTNGVTVTGNKEYTVNADTTVTINGIKVTTQKETVINANGKAIRVTANKETNNLVFENLIAENIAETEAKITFVGSEDLTDKQLGTITIKTTGGKVTVEQENVNVSSELNVEVNSGEVVIQNEAFTGDKNITVTNGEEGTTTVKALSNTNAPINMTDIELKEYTDEEFAQAFPDVKDAKTIAAIREYINAFGINGKGAKITVAGNSNEVTIVFSENVEKVNISNIK